MFETGVFEKDRYLGYISYKAQREPTASRRLSGVRRASGRYCSTRKIYECQTRRSDTFLGSGKTYPTSKCKFFFLIYASLADKNISPAARWIQHFSFTLESLCSFRGKSSREEERKKK